MCTCSEDIVKTLFINLTAIGNIKPGYKINSKEKYLELDDSTIYQGFLRLYRGDSRQASVEKVDSIIKKTHLLVREAIKRYTSYESGDFDNDEEEMKYMNNNYTPLEFLEVLLPKLENAIDGITNLKDNYTSDTTITSLFDLNLLSLQKNISDIKSILKIE